MTGVEAKLDTLVFFNGMDRHGNRSGMTLIRYRRAIGPMLLTLIVMAQW